MKLVAVVIVVVMRYTTESMIAFAGRQVSPVVVVAPPETVVGAKLVSQAAEAFVNVPPNPEE